MGSRDTELLDRLTHTDAVVLAEVATQRVSVVLRVDAACSVVAPTLRARKGTTESGRVRLASQCSDLRGITRAFDPFRALTTAPTRPHAHRRGLVETLITRYRRVKKRLTH